jgi:hypothetical protein
MPLAPVRFPKFPGLRCTAAAAFVELGLLLAVGCTSPKAAAIPASKPGSAVAEAAGRSNAADSTPPVAPDPFVAAVRAGTMSGYPQATIGHAFESAFSNVHWSSQQPKGEARVVTFTGTLPADMRPNCGAAKSNADASLCAQDAKVTFQWSFASDGLLFHLSHVNPDAWPEDRRSTRDIMLYIFG